MFLEQQLFFIVIILMIKYYIDCIRLATKVFKKLIFLNQLTKLSHKFISKLKKI